ncbi:MAG: hypothetical protein Q9182_000329 [Xanthomendoza sp. 2 TL-2023]
MANVSSAGGLTPASLETIIWLVVAIAILFALIRFTIRLYALRKLLWDDLAVAGALILLLTLAVMYRYATPIMFELVNIAEGKEIPTPDFLRRSTVFLKLQFAIIVMFWTEIWSVKASFLIFYRNLFAGLPEQMLGWWLVCGFTVINAREKLALGTIFSVGVIKITFAVIRVVKIGASAKHVNPIWLALWSMIEASVAVVVASLPSFRVLFAHGRRQSQIRRAVTLKTFHRRRSQRYSNDEIEPLDSEVRSDGARSPANGTEEVGVERQRAS